jgi:hypothetical protein
MEYLTSPLAYWEGYPVKSLPIHTLVQVCPTTAPFGQQVKERIEQEGLALPLLCADMALERLIEWYETYQETKEKQGMLSPNTYPKTDRCIVVFGGNTRLVIAKELGYTHIDCIVLNWKNDRVEGERMDYMWELQRKQRREFPEMYPEEKL